MIRALFIFIILNLTGFLIFSGYLYRQGDVFQTYVELKMDASEVWSKLTDPTELKTFFPNYIHDLVVLSSNIDADQSRQIEITDQWGNTAVGTLTYEERFKVLEIKTKLHHFYVQLEELENDGLEANKSRLFWLDHWNKEKGPLDWFLYKQAVASGLSRLRLVTP